MKKLFQTSVMIMSLVASAVMTTGCGSDDQTQPVANGVVGTPAAVMPPNGCPAGLSWNGSSCAPSNCPQINNTQYPGYNLAWNPTQGGCYNTNPAGVAQYTQQFAGRTYSVWRRNPTNPNFVCNILVDDFGRQVAPDINCVYSPVQYNQQQYFNGGVWVRF